MTQKDNNPVTGGLGISGRIAATSSWMVSTAMPGREIDMTCSTPVMRDSTCSAGVATILSTSRVLAPGKEIMTLAMVTSI